MVIATCLSLTVPAFADEYSFNRNNIINEQTLQDEPMIDLGGGPSPSGQFEKIGEESVRLTYDEVNELNYELQKTIASNRYNLGKQAYSWSVALVGFYTIKKVLPIKGTVGIKINKWIQASPGIASTMLGIFGKTYHSVIQDSANTLSRKLSFMNRTGQKSTVVRIVIYERPASGEILLAIK